MTGASDVVAEIRLAHEVPPESGPRSLPAGRRGTMRIAVGGMGTLWYTRAHLGVRSEGRRTGVKADSSAGGGRMMMLRQAATWKVAAPMVVGGLVAMLAIGACGDSDGSCDYLFADVPTAEDCGAGAHESTDRGQPAGGIRLRQRRLHALDRGLPAHLLPDLQRRGRRLRRRRRRRPVTTDNTDPLPPRSKGHGRRGGGPGICVHLRPSVSPRRASSSKKPPARIPP